MPSSQLDQIVQKLYHVSFVTADVDCFQVGRHIALLTVDFSKNFHIVLTVHIEVSPYACPLNRIAEFGTGVAGTYPRYTGFIAVDIDTCLRFAEFQVYVRHLPDTGLSYTWP